MVHTGQRAIGLLKASDFDIISLDYNLRGELNGAGVAQGLKHSRNQNARIIIHSLNPKAVNSILAILPDAITYPVSKMIRWNKNFKDLRNKIDRLGGVYDWI